MNTPLEALYVHACERRDLARWLSDPDAITDYHQTAARADKQSAQLTERLSPQDASLLEKLLNNLQDVHSLELEMYFYQGVAIGLQLVSLTQFV